MLLKQIYIVCGVALCAHTPSASFLMSPLSPPVLLGPWSRGVPLPFGLPGRTTLPTLRRVLSWSVALLLSTPVLTRSSGGYWLDLLAGSPSALGARRFDAVFVESGHAPRCLYIMIQPGRKSDSLRLIESLTAARDNEKNPMVFTLRGAER